MHSFERAYKELIKTPWEEMRKLLWQEKWILTMFCVPVIIGYAIMTFGKTWLAIIPFIFGIGYAVYKVNKMDKDLYENRTKYFEKYKGERLLKVKELLKEYEIEEKEQLEILISRCDREISSESSGAEFLKASFERLFNISFTAISGFIGAFLSKMTMEDFVSATDFFVQFLTIMVIMYVIVVSSVAIIIQDNPFKKTKRIATQRKDDLENILVFYHKDFK